MENAGLGQLARQAAQAQQAQQAQQRERERNAYYSYGADSDKFLNEILGLIGDDETPLKLASGGLIPPLMAMGGMSKTPHKGSHYVQGDGGGQDDLIEARLADGEYVFDADVVSALGDGSNKEGAKKLDQMRVAIRTHKRAASPGKIPPMAKSPLAYMKGLK